MVVAELLTKLGFKVDATEMTKGITQARSALSEFKSFVGKLALGYTFFEIGKHVLDTARELETMTTQLHTMTGSAEKTQMLFKGITNYAKETSYYIKDVLAATVQLKLGQVATSAIMPKVRQLGDIASNSEQLNSLAMSYGRTNAQGFMSGQELMMMRRGGNFNPLQQLALMRTEQAGLMKKGEEILTGSVAEKYMRQQQAGLRDMVRQKLITIDMVDQAIAYATTKGGLYFEHQAQQVKTFTGAFSNMLDNLQINAGIALQKLFPLFKQLMAVITALPMDWLEGAFDTLAKSIQYLWLVIKSAGIQEAFENLKTAFFEFLDAVTEAMGGTAGYGDILLTLGQVIGFLLTRFLDGLIVIVKFATMLAELFGWLRRSSEALKILGIILVAVFGPALWARLVTTRLMALGVVGGFSGIGRAVLLAGTMLKWFAEDPVTTAKIAIEALRAGLIGTVGVAGLAAAAVLSVAWAAYELYKTLNENKALQDNKDYAEQDTKIIQKKIENIKVWKEAIARGDTETSDRYRRIMGQNDAERSALKAKFGIHEAVAPGMGGPGTFGDFSSGVDKMRASLLKSQSEASAQSAADARKTHALLGAIAGNTGKIGTVPNDVLRLGNMAQRSHFAMELQHVLVAAEG